MKTGIKWGCVLLLTACISVGCTAQKETAPAVEKAEVKATSAIAPPTKVSAAKPAAPKPPSPTVEPAPTPKSPVSPCPAGASVAKAVDVLFTVGNQWTYTYVEGWHSANRDWGDKTFVVKQRTQIGPYTVAEMAVTFASRRGEKKETSTYYRIAKGEKICQFEHWDDKANGGGTSEKWAKERFEGAYLCWDLSKAKKVPMVSCLGAVCGPMQVVEGMADQGARFWGPVGIASTWSDDYSPETGDGTGTALVLTSYSLAKSVPGAVVKVTPTPASFIAFKKGLAKAKSGGMVAVKDAVAKDVTYSINPEHRVKHGALESWQKDGNRSGATLADLVEGPCGHVTSDSVSYVVCPMALAEEYAAQATACGRAAAPSRARAVFQARQGAWQLTALLLGGVDDLYANTESSDLPAKPWSQYSQFE